MIAPSTPLPTVAFAMTYPDSEGNVWTRIAQLYDRIAGQLVEQGVRCVIAYPKLTGRPHVALKRLVPVEVDLRHFDVAGRQAIDAFLVDQHVRAIVYMDMDPGQVSFSLLRKRHVRSINFSQYNFADETTPSWPRQLVNHLRGRLGLVHHDMYVANSRHQHDLLIRRLGIPDARLALAVNGIDARMFSPGPKPDPSRWNLPQTDHYAIAVCQARPEKRVDFLIDVAAELFARRPALSLTFVHAGDGGKRQAWQQKAAAMGLADRFHFVGAQSDVTPLYRLADVMLHAPSRESFGFVLTEAMACGLPVICSKVGGPREIIEHEQTGYLLPFDDRDAFVDRLIDLFDQPQHRAKLGMAGRRRVLEHFTIERQVDDMVGVIGSMIEPAYAG